MAVEHGTGMQSDLLDICQNAYSDFYADLFSSTIIKRYLRGTEKGSIQSNFEAYINGIIKNKIFENADKSGLISHRRLSEKEIFDRLVGSKKLETKRHYIGLAKARYTGRVRRYLLTDYPEPIHNVVDYFFERFCETAYVALIAQGMGGGAVLTQLLNRFTREDYEKGLNYSATIPPMPEPKQAGLPQLGDEDDGATEEERLTLLAVQGEPGSDAPTVPDELRAQRNVWWDQLLQASPPNRDELEDQIRTLKVIGDKPDLEGCALCYACANLMRSGTEATKRNLKIFLIHHLSYSTTKRERPGHLDPDNLRLEDIEGLCLTWDEASRLVGKNPDYSAHSRIKERVRQEFTKAWESISDEPYAEGP